MEGQYLSIVIAAVGGEAAGGEFKIDHAVFVDRKGNVGASLLCRYDLACNERFCFRAKQVGLRLGEVFRLAEVVPQLERVTGVFVNVLGDKGKAAIAGYLKAAGKAVAVDVPQDARIALAVSYDDCGLIPKPPWKGVKGTPCSSKTSPNVQYE